MEVREAAPLIYTQGAKTAQRTYGFPRACLYIATRFMSHTLVVQPRLVSAIISSVGDCAGATQESAPLLRIGACAMPRRWKEPRAWWWLC